MSTEPKSRDDIAVEEFFRVRSIRTNKLDMKNHFENCEFYLRKFEEEVANREDDPEQPGTYEHARSFVFRIMAHAAPATPAPESPAPALALLDHLYRIRNVFQGLSWWSAPKIRELMLAGIGEVKAAVESLGYVYEESGRASVPERKAE